MALNNARQQMKLTHSYSYNKGQQEAPFLKIYFDKVLYMFRTDLLSIIRRLHTVYAAIGIVATLADSQQN